LAHFFVSVFQSRRRWGKRGCVPHKGPGRSRVTEEYQGVKRCEVHPSSTSHSTYWRGLGSFFFFFFFFFFLETL
jgi:hypothetical protein